MSHGRTVVVNFTRMGDLIQSGPLLRSLKDDRRERELILIVFSAFVEAAWRLPMVDRVIAFDVDRLVSELDSRRGWWKRAYRDAACFLSESDVDNVDEVYNLAHTRQSAMLCALLRPRSIHGMTRSATGRIRVNGDWFTYLLSIMRARSLNPFNLVEIYQRFANVGVRSNRLEFAIRGEDREAARALLTGRGLSASERYMVLQPGASSPTRQWPPDRFAAVAIALMRNGIRSILTGSASESEMGAMISRHSRGAAISVAGQTSIGTLTALLERAEKVLSNDTGTIHLAAAVGTPTVGVFIGPASAKDTAPFGNGHIVIEPDLECAPCGYHDECRAADCGRKISMDHVLRALLHGSEEIPAIDSLWNGVRIYRTEVEDTSEFHLRPLNHPRTQRDTHWLEWYRWFWDALLGRQAGNREIAPSYVPLMECADGVGALTNVFMKARSQIASLRVAMDESPRSAARTSRALANQMTWQNELREFVERYPLLAPLPRFLLTRLSMVYGDDLREYVSDLENIVAAYDCGMSLLKSENRNQMKRVVHAVA